MRKIKILILFVSFILLVTAAISCESSHEPDYTKVAVFRGNAYDRGFQHGEQFAPIIKSLYTKLLTTAIIPYLNREQMSIAPVLPTYNLPAYRDGKFSELMMLESGQFMFDNYLTDEYRDEMRGLAKGSGLSLDQVIILNTFFDTMMGFRAIVSFIQGIQEPYVESIEVVDLLAIVDVDGDSDLEGETAQPVKLLASDNIDNDGDGETDEEDEGFVAYEPSDHAILSEVPINASIKFIIKDTKLDGLACVDPRNVDEITDFKMDIECVEKSCLKPECLNNSVVGRDCFDEEIIFACLEPRIPGTCLDINCIELADPGCVNEESIRIRMNEVQYIFSDSEIKITRLPVEDKDDKTDGDADSETSEYPYAVDCQGALEVIFTPKDGFPKNSVVSMLIQAGDISPVYSPEPFHNRFMRDELIVFSTKGYGKAVLEIEKIGVPDPTKQPPSLSFALRGSATKDGNPLVGSHYALLDNDMIHEHSIVATHVPENGSPYTILTFAGLIWGFSGMNADGLTFAFTNSDSLDNPLIGDALDGIFDNIVELLFNMDLVGLSAALADVKLIAAGMPIGIAGREILSKEKTVAGSIDRLYKIKQTYGWNIMLADKTGDMAIVEVDSHSQAKEGKIGGDIPVNEDGFYFYNPDVNDPENLNASGKPFASVRADDLRMGSHFQKNLEDIGTSTDGHAISIMGLFAPKRQKDWTGFYYRSLRTFYLLGDEIEKRYGSIGVNEAIEILRTPSLVDRRDSMNACVFEPARGVLHWAMGGVPATDQEFIELDIKAMASEGGVK